MTHWGEELTVAERMVTPVHTIHESERLAVAERRLAELGFSALPVVDDTSQLGGIVTQSDLYRIGRVREGRAGRRTLALPDARLREHMTSPVEVTPPNASLADAAGRMVRRRVHRLYVTHNRSVVGVLTTRELMLAVSEARVALPLRDMISGAAAVLRSGDPLGVALDRMAASEGRAALVVVEEGLPVGVFARREALAAQHAAGSSAIDGWMSPAILCVAPQLPAHRAAACAAACGPRALVVVDGREVLGVLSGLDFAALVAAA